MMAPSMADTQEPAAMNAASNELTQPSNSPGTVGQAVNRELDSEEKKSPPPHKAIWDATDKDSSPQAVQGACDECRRKKPAGGLYTPGHLIDGITKLAAS